MKKFLISLALVSYMVLVAALSVNAQYTETFESQTPFTHSFVSSGQPFTLTNSFIIYSSRGGYGYQHSNRFIDNSVNVLTNQTNSIKTADGTKFKLNSLWLYVSTDGGNNPSTDGSVIITGKLGGVTQFTINKTTGFSASFVPDNGFSFVNFGTEGGVDNSVTDIDEIQFQLQGNFNYIAIDNFTWTPLTVLPVSLLSYSAVVVPGGKVKLSWQTGYENNIGNFIIEKSSDGLHFSRAGSIAANGNTSIATSYGFVDAAPLQGINYYRLSEVDKNGAVKQLGVKTVTMFNKFGRAVLFPNPITNGHLTLNSEPSANGENIYLISDMSGRILHKGTITSTQQLIDVSRLAAGNYTLTLSDGEVIKWVKN